MVLVDFISEREEESKEEGSEAFDKNTVENVGFPDWAKRVLFAWLTTEERDLAWEEEALTKREAEEANTTHRHTDIAATHTHQREKTQQNNILDIFTRNYPGYGKLTFLSLVLLSSSFSLRPSFSPPHRFFIPLFFSSNMSNVRVVCRTRPLNRAEIERGGYNILEYSSDFSSMQIQNPGDERMKHTFNFDRCFPPGTHQADVYNFVAKPILDDVFHGYNGTLFVYGQTGSGLLLHDGQSTMSSD